MSRRFSTVMLGLILVVFAGLALMGGALPLNELLTDVERPMWPRF